MFGSLEDIKSLKKTIGEQKIQELFCAILKKRMHHLRSILLKTLFCISKAGLMNNGILNLHLEILDKKRQKLLQKLLPFTKRFVLGGRTALALQLAHRISFDFDFFTQTEIPI